MKLNEVSLQRGTQLLLDKVSVQFNRGQKSALIGANGIGKSSLFSLLLNDISAETGDILIPKGWAIAHMAQEILPTEQSARNYVMDGDQPLRELERKIFAAEKNNELQRLAHLYQQLDDIDGYKAPVKVEQLLLGLKFSMSDLDKPVNTFSGGWRIRLNLAKALMCRSDLLLLDEPTNHLDIDASLWLEKWLQRYPGTLLMISHDRDFIDNTCDSIAHIEHKQLTLYKGNYSAFERQRAERLALQQANYVKQQREIAHMEKFITRFKAKATKAKQAQSRIKALERMQLIAPAHVDSPFNFTFPTPERFSDPLLNLAHVNAGYGENVVLNDVGVSIHPGTRIGLLGANGAGKSTLVKVLAGELEPMQGQRVCGEHLRVGYFSQHQVEHLDLEASPKLHLQRLSPDATEQSLRNYLGGFNFGGEMALSNIRHFSGGEKARLALAIVVWLKPNLLLLDEPTNHLDLEMRHALTVALQSFDGAVILVSHDRHLLKNTVDEFLLIHNYCVEPFVGDLNDYSRWLLQQHKLLSKPDEASAELPPQQNSRQSGDTSKSLNKKQLRQQNAQRRQAQANLQKDLRTTENKLKTIGKQLAEIEHELTMESIYADENKQQLQSLLEKQGKLAANKSELEEKWLSLSEQIGD